MLYPVDHFTAWLTQRAHEAGHDTGTPDGQDAIAAIACLAASNGLTIADANHIADVLHLSPAEVTAACIAAD